MALTFGVKSIVALHDHLSETDDVASWNKPYSTCCAVSTPGPFKTAEQTQPGASRGNTSNRASCAKLRSSGGSILSAADNLDAQRGSFWHTMPSGGHGSSGVFPSGGNRPMATSSRPATATSTAADVRGVRPATAQRKHGNVAQRPLTAVCSTVSHLQQPTSSTAAAALEHWQSDSAVARIVSVWEDRAATAAMSTATQQHPISPMLHAGNVKASSPPQAQHMPSPHQPPETPSEHKHQSAQYAEGWPARQPSPQSTSPHSPVQLWRLQDSMNHMSSASECSLPADDMLCT
jgi:hypothetical protein